LLRAYTPPPSPQTLAPASRPAVAEPPALGAQSDLSRFGAGLRALVVMLVALELAAQGLEGGWTAWLLLSYAFWSGILLWAEARGRPLPHPALHPWIDVAWSAFVVLGAAGAADMMALTFILPVVMASVLHGFRQGVMLACFATLALALSITGAAWQGTLPMDRLHFLPALGLLTLAPAAALLSRPMHLLRRRAALEGRFEAEIDPRRGLEAACATVAERLRTETGARVVAVVLPKARGPALVSSSTEGTFRTSEAIQLQFEQHLAGLPATPITYRPRQWLGLRGGVKSQDRSTDPAPLKESMAQLAAMLECGRLAALPMALGDRLQAHLLVGDLPSQRDNWSIGSLAALGPTLMRLFERAGLVDELNEEIAAHARVRIGRDLHDSAIQPYLGLRYAIEALALRTPIDNPLHAEITALLSLMNHEVDELREVISVLRSGRPKGDNALVPAVRRQARRFSVLFGIEVHLDCAEDITTSRALAGSVFHMVNEALNNVRKHTSARNAWIQMKMLGDSIQLSVRDDAGSLQGGPVGDFVPKSLTERVREMGGALSISRPNGLDTEIAISIPL
jgi:signal transduction histidine kinase